MGLDITYKAGKQKIFFRLSSSDVEIFNFLRKKGFNKEVDKILNVSSFGVENSVERKNLLEVIECLLEELNKRSNILPYIYGFKQEIPRGSGNYSSGAGKISGVRINGELYLFEAGLDQCSSTRYWQDDTGKLKYDAPRDIRAKTAIKINEDQNSDIPFGDIFIEKKKKPINLITYLKKLKLFLSESDARMVQKLLG